MASAGTDRRTAIAAASNGSSTPAATCPASWKRWRARMSPSSRITWCWWSAKSTATRIPSTSGLADWNDACRRAHEELFVRVRADLPRLVSWVNSRFDATVYEDAYSPFCLIAGNNGDADAIHQYMEEYCLEVPESEGHAQRRLCAVLPRELRQRHGAGGNRRAGSESAPTHIFAAGDHFNDLPMLAAALCPVSGRPGQCHRGRQRRPSAPKMDS